MPTGGWDKRPAEQKFPYGMRNQTDLFDADTNGKFRVCAPELPAGNYTNVIELKEDVPAGQKLFLYYQLDNFY